jgi:hypothetical protein
MVLISNPAREAQTRLRKLEAEATHARQRYELYKAKTEGSGSTSPDRLRDLKRLFETAETRLEQARANA